jgi:hypothetical protein
MQRWPRSAARCEQGDELTAIIGVVGVQGLQWTLYVW